jgi:hypothetical protein
MGSIRSTKTAIECTARTTRSSLLSSVRCTAPTTPANPHDSDRYRDGRNRQSWVVADTLHARSPVTGLRDGRTAPPRGVNAASQLIWAECGPRDAFRVRRDKRWRVVDERTWRLVGVVHGARRRWQTVTGRRRWQELDRGLRAMERGAEQAKRRARKVAMSDCLATQFTDDPERRRFPSRSVGFGWIPTRLVR